MTATVSGYDGFISYSHQHDAALGPALQTSLERFAKPWYKMRALRIFLDAADLSANPALWPSIEDGLSSSRWFILLASVDAAESKWVDREVQWWINHGSRDRLLVAGTSPGLDWDEKKRDWAADAPVPPALRGAFREEPFWVDLSEVRLDSAKPKIPVNKVAAVAAPLRGKNLDELVGEHLRQHRRAMRLAEGAVAVMAVLTALAVVFSILAVRERNSAIRERNQAVSADVATVANQLYTSNPALAGQLSLAAFKLAPSPEAYGSLLNATAKPLAGQLAPIPDSDEEAFNADGSMLATSSTGGVQLWHVNAADPTSPTLVTTIRSTHAITSSPQLWFDPGNSTILAILSGGYISLEDIDHPSPFSAGNRTDTANDLAFSHNGRIAAVGYTNGNVQLWNVADPGNPTAIGSPFRAPGAPDNEVTRLAFSPDGSMLATVSGPILIPGSPEATETVRLWSLADPAKPALYPVPLASTTTMLAFSPVGHILATGSADNTVQLWNVTDPGHPTPTGSPLSGHTGTIDEMAFSADGDTLATASWDGSVRLWNVTDPAHPTALAVMGREPSMIVFASVAISPDDRLLAATGIGVVGSSIAGETWLWEINRQQAAAYVCVSGGSSSPGNAVSEVLSPSITQAQWRLYFSGEAYSPPCHPTPMVSLTEGEKKLVSQLNSNRLTNCTGRSGLEGNGIVAAINCQSTEAGPTKRPLVVQFADIGSAEQWFRNNTVGFVGGDACASGTKLGSWTHDGVTAGMLGCSYTDGRFRIVWVIDSALIGVIADGSDGPAMYDWWANTACLGREGAVCTE
jgi:WD40 repeat protein